MNKKITIALILILGVIAFLVFRAPNNSNVFVNPGIGKPTVNSQAQPAPSSFNPPKEIKYSSSTDLKKELDSVDPQILESDFAQ